MEEKKEKLERLLMDYLERHTKDTQLLPKMQKKK